MKAHIMCVMDIMKEIWCRDVRGTTMLISLFIQGGVEMAGIYESSRGGKSMMFTGATKTARTAKFKTIEAH